MDSHDDITILRSSTDADFLAMLPTLVGRTVSHSLLVVPFAGKRTTGGMRIDLPDAGADVSVHERLASVALGAMSRLEWCDAVTFAVYTDETFPAAFAGHEALVNHLSERFTEAGFIVRDAFCVAGDGWASWFDEAPAFEGRSLDEIARSALAAETRAAVNGRELEPHDAGAQLPTADPRLAELLTSAVDGLLTESVERDAFGRWLPASLPHPVPFIETLLQRSAPDTPIPLLARLAALSVHPAHRDVMMLQIAFGRKVGKRAYAENSRWLAAQAESGLPMDDVVRAELESGDARATSEMGELLTGEAGTPPRPARIERAIGLLRRTIVHLPSDLRPDLLCMLAWLHWAMGASTVAGAHIAAAIEIDPQHGMAQILHVLVASGKIPEWIFAHYNEASRALRTRMPTEATASAG